MIKFISEGLPQEQGHAHSHDELEKHVHEVGNTLQFHSKDEWSHKGGNA